MDGSCSLWHFMGSLLGLLLGAPCGAAIVVEDVETGRKELFDDPSETERPFYFSVSVARRFGSRRFHMSIPASNAEWQDKLNSASLLSLHATSDDSPAACVDPFWACCATNLPQPRGIAANWYWLKALTGNTHPGASLPHGMVSVVAFSGGYPSGYGVNGGSSEGLPASIFSGDYSKTENFARIPNQYSTTGFTHFQPSGTGSIGNYMNYLKVMPLASPPSEFLEAGAPWLERRRATLLGERAEPGRYAAIVGEENVHAEVTTGPGVALHRYRFNTIRPSGRMPVKEQTIAVELSAAGLVLDSSHIQKCQGLEVSVVGDIVEGAIYTPGPAGSSKPGLKLYFSINLGSSVMSFWPENLNKTGFKLTGADIASLGGNVGVIASVNATAEVRIGFSLRNLASARANIDAAAQVTFDEVVDAAWREWNDALSRIRIEDDTSNPGAMSSRNLFYSVLFHALRKPTDFTDHVPDEWTAHGSFPGYVFDLGTMWDQYKTTLPLVLSVYPKMGGRILNGLLNIARRYGDFAIGYTMDEDVFRFQNQARGLAHMTLADGSYRNYSLDWQVALDLMTHTFTTDDQARAFVSAGETVPLLTHTLDLSGAAFATAQVAYTVGNTSAEKWMKSLTKNALNAFNRSSCLLRNGSNTTYYEGTYMNYGFRPLPDTAARIALCASTAQYVQLMDAFFGYGRDPVVELPILPWQAAHPPWVRERISNVGYDSHTYEGLCNEPDMETPYTYAYAGRADRVQEIVTAVKTYSYAPGRGGLAGNDDSGGEAAWYIWSSLGLFPVAGQPVYILGSPSFQVVSVHLGNSVLRILRKGRGRYIQDGTLNGKPLEGRSWLWVYEAHAGGELAFNMGAAPSIEWGSKLPPSFSVASEDAPQAFV